MNRPFSNDTDRTCMAYHNIKPKSAAAFQLLARHDGYDAGKDIQLKRESLIDIHTSDPKCKVLKTLTLLGL